MGAANSQPTFAVLVRLLPPPQELAPSGSFFFARLHSAADGVSRCKRWGEPQPLGLWSDDIITVSVYTARSERHFIRDKCEDFAEIHVPWEIISMCLRDGEEVSFDLGMDPNVPWLGHQASPSQYRDAFYRSCELAQAGAPRLTIGLFAFDPAILQFPEEEAKAALSQIPINPAGMPPPIVPMMPQLSADSYATLPMPQLSGTMQACPPQFVNGPPSPMIPCTAASLLQCQLDGEAHDQLTWALSENYRLRAEEHTSIRELAELEASLSVEQRLVLSNGMATPPATSFSLQCESEHDWEAQATGMMEDIRAAHETNLDLIGQHDKQVKSLEDQISAARRRQADTEAQSIVNPEAEHRQKLQEKEDELQAINDDTDDIQVRISKEMQKGVGADVGRQIQQLQLEHEVQQEEIGHLRQILECQRAEKAGGGGDEPMRPPGTEVLLSEVDHMEAELATVQQRGAREQATLEQQSLALREESKQLQELIQATAAQKIVAEAELETLRKNPPKGRGTDASASQELMEERQRQETLAKEVSRSRSRIQFSEEKIRQLREEAEDLRQRASLVLSVMPSDQGEVAEVNDTPRTTNSNFALLTVVRQHEEKLQKLTEDEEKVRCQQDEMQQTIAAAKVQATVMEKKMSLLRSRMVQPVH